MVTSRVSRLSSWEITIRCPAVLDVFICEGEMNETFAPIQRVGKGPTFVDEEAARPPYKENQGTTEEDLEELAFTHQGK